MGPPEIIIVYPFEKSKKSFKLTDAVNARLDHRGCEEVDEGWAVQSVRKVLVNPAHHRLVAVPTEQNVKNHDSDWLCLRHSHLLFFRSKLSSLASLSPDPA